MSRNLVENSLENNSDGKLNQSRRTYETHEFVPKESWKSVKLKYTSHAKRSLEVKF